MGKIPDIFNIYNIYIFQVIPMLPRVLCEELCSLNPGVSRLTFSIVWIMDNDANIIERWIGRSIIKSCAKLAYEHAQVFPDINGEFFGCWPLPLGWGTSEEISNTSD